jgi:ABC-2 type transport system ATP-binding protein
VSEFAIRLDGVSKAYRFFELRDVTLRLAAGQILGLVGPNGAGKSTTMRILMAFVEQDGGDVEVLGYSMPRQQAVAKRDVGFVSDEMGLYSPETLAWHMSFVAGIYPSWDQAYAEQLLNRFNLRAAQPVKGLSHGERIKAGLLLALARRPRLLVLDEPTTGLDPVARYEVLNELMEVIADERRAVLFSSHNTHDVEQISDQIAFMDRGQLIDTSDKETFLDRWRRMQLDVPEGGTVPLVPGIVDLQTTGRVAVATTNAYTPSLTTELQRAGATVREIQRMTLEEIFVATVMHSRREPVA